MDEIREALLAFIEEMARDIDNISDDEFDRIMIILEEMIGVLNQLQQEQAPTAPLEQAQTPIKPGPYPSSNVNGFHYDPQTKELKVQFHGPYPQAEGSIYSYKNVPEYIYDIFSRGAVGPKTSGQNRYHKWIKGVTPSLGGSLNALLKAGKFPYQRLS